MVIALLFSKSLRLRFGVSYIILAGMEMVTSLHVKCLTGLSLYYGNYFIIDMLHKCAREFKLKFKLFHPYGKIFVFIYNVSL